MTDHATSTVVNSTDSPLLRLPSEIRNEIFTYAATNTTGTVCVEANGSTVDGFTFRLVEQSDAAFQLPQVCRQLYAETATKCYAENDFTFFRPEEMRQDYAHFLQVWLKQRLPAQARVIRSLSLKKVFRCFFRYCSRRSCSCIHVKQKQAERLIKKFCPQLKTIDHKAFGVTATT